MRLYFQNSMGKRKFISQVYFMKEISAIIADVLEEHNYKSYYTRIWYEKEKKELWFDVGSHSEFFVVTEVEENSQLLESLKENNNG